MRSDTCNTDEVPIGFLAREPALQDRRSRPTRAQHQEPRHPSPKGQCQAASSIPSMKGEMLPFDFFPDFLRPLFAMSVTVPPVSHSSSAFRRALSPRVSR